MHVEMFRVTYPAHKGPQRIATLLFLWVKASTVFNGHAAVLCEIHCKTWVYHTS